MSIQTYGISKSATTGAWRRQSKFLFRKLSKILPHRTVTSVEQHDFIKKRIRKFLILATTLGSILCLGMVSSPVVLADGGKGIAHRVAVLEAKEEIRGTLHAFVNALNSSFISGETDPLGAIAAVFHPGIVLSATPPPTPLDPMPTPMIFTGINQVVGGYGQVVVANTKPNILASSMDVKLLNKHSAEADLRFANSVNFPAGCMLDTPGCAKVLLFADVFVSFERGARRAWQVTNVDLVHYIAHGSPPSMMP